MPAGLKGSAWSAAVADRRRLNAVVLVQTVRAYTVVDGAQWTVVEIGVHSAKFSQGTGKS